MRQDNLQQTRVEVSSLYVEEYSICNIEYAGPRSNIDKSSSSLAISELEDLVGSAGGMLSLSPKKLRERKPNCWIQSERFGSR